MTIHIIGDNGFVLRDRRIEDGADPDMAPALQELETFIREKFSGAQFLVMVGMPKRSHYLAGDADGPLRREDGMAMAKRLHTYLTTGR